MSPAPDRSRVENPARLAALRRTRLLDTAPEEALDRFVRLAARVLDAPVALISLVDGDRQFFKAHVGLGEPWATSQQTPLSHSFCAHCIATDEAFVVTDAREHPLVHDNGAIEDLDVISYCGTPIRTSDGFPIGSFCVIDGAPRHWTPLDVETLERLAAALIDEIEQREETAGPGSEQGDAFDWLAAVTHDLKVPIAAMVGAAELLSIDATRLSDDDRAMLLDLIQRQGEHLSLMNERLLKVARSGPASLRREEVDLAAVAASVVESFTASGVRQELVLDTEPLTLPSDEAAVRRILLNLVDNACKYSSPSDGPVRVSVRTDGPVAVIEVADRGPGMSAEEAQRVFERYWQGDDTPGAGIGLHSVRRIAEALGGAVSLTTAPGEGATFTVRLPIAV